MAEGYFQVSQRKTADALLLGSWEGFELITVRSHRFTLNENAIRSEVESELSILLHETGFKHDQWFFWEHAEDIAQRHHIPLNELILSM